MKKKNDQVSCPASTGKKKWMKLTGPVTFIYINKYSTTEILPFCLTQLISDRTSCHTIQG